MTDRLFDILHLNLMSFPKIESKAVHELNQLFLFFIVKCLYIVIHGKNRRMLIIIHFLLRKLKTDIIHPIK